MRLREVFIGISETCDIAMVSSDDDGSFALVV